MEYQTYEITQEIHSVAARLGSVKTKSELYEVSKTIAWLNRLTNREIDAIRMTEESNEAWDEFELDWLKEQIGNNHMAIGDLYENIKAISKHINTSRLI